MAGGKEPYARSKRKELAARGGWLLSGVVNQRFLRVRGQVRLLVAAGLGLVAIGGSVALVAADGIGGGIRWTHHPGVSAAPLLVVAGAIAAVSVAHPVGGRRELMRFVAALAFTAWGLAQLFPDAGAAGVLNDLAILLFVVDAGCAVAGDTGVLRWPRGPGTGSRASREVAQTDSPARRPSR